jgi:hypothetical protein
MVYDSTAVDTQQEIHLMSNSKHNCSLLIAPSKVILMHEHTVIIIIIIIIITIL